MGFFSELFDFVVEAATETPLPSLISAGLAPEFGAAGLFAGDFGFDPSEFVAVPEVDFSFDPSEFVAVPDVPLPRYDDWIGNVVAEVPETPSAVFTSEVGNVMPDVYDEWGWGDQPGFGTNGTQMTVPGDASWGVNPILGAASTAVTLLGRLKAMFGGAVTAGVSSGAIRRAGTFALGGLKGSLAQLWPAVRKYGPTAVAAALGVTAAQLAQILMEAPRNPPKRRRGISARDIRTTTRVVRFTNKMQHTIGCVTRPRWSGRGGHGHRVRSTK